MDLRKNIKINKKYMKTVIMTPLKKQIFFYRLNFLILSSYNDSIKPSLPSADSEYNACLHEISQLAKWTCNGDGKGQCFLREFLVQQCFACCATAM